jgi:hypothetical protein
MKQNQNSHVLQQDRYAGIAAQCLESGLGNVRAERYVSHFFCFCFVFCVSVFYCCRLSSYQSQTRLKRIAFFNCIFRAFLLQLYIIFLPSAAREVAVLVDAFAVGNVERETFHDEIAAIRGKFKLLSAHLKLGARVTPPTGEAEGLSF